ncbi:MAG: hypothetical protein ACPH15_04710, partial [Pseudomonadales bacterium]
FESQFDEAGVLLKPGLAVGQFVTAQIAGNRVENSFLIPRSALRQQQQIWIVENSRLAYLDVNVVQINNETALVQLKADALPTGTVSVITSELSLALSGMKVRERALINLESSGGASHNQAISQE